MPGSIVTCQGLSSTYNSFYVAQNSSLTTFTGLTIDASNDTFNVQSPASNFPFLTGETVYYASTSSNLTLVKMYYAIRVNANSIKVATSVANAFAGTAVDLTTNSDSTNTLTNQHQISNAMMLVHSGPNLPFNNIFNRANYQGAAYSTITFSITENIRFDFTLESCVFAGIITTSESYGVGVGLTRVATTGSAGVVLGREHNGSTNTGRWLIASGTISSIAISITIQNRIITVRGNNTTYTTSTITNTEQFRFFAYFSLNSTAVRDCTITYL